MTRGRRAALLGAATALVAGAACTTVATDPGAVVSVVQDSSVVPSIVAGDTLRDTNGVALPLRKLARAFNGQGQVLASPTEQFFVTTIDTTANAKQLASIVYVKNGSDSVAYLVAAPGPVRRTAAVTVNVQFSRALRLPTRFAVVPRPDLVERDTATSSTVSFTTGTPATAVANFSVRVSYDSAGTRSPVRATLVRFALVGLSRNAIDTVRFVEGAGRDSTSTARIDTTDENGLASRSLTVTRRAVSGSSALTRDSITVIATVLVPRAIGQPTRLPSLPLVVTVVDSARVSATSVSTSRARPRH